MVLREGRQRLEPPTRWWIEARSDSVWWLVLRRKREKAGLSCVGRLNPRMHWASPFVGHGTDKRDVGDQPLLIHILRPCEPNPNHSRRARVCMPPDRTDVGFGQPEAAGGGYRPHPVSQSCFALEPLFQIAKLPANPAPTPVIRMPPGICGFGSPDKPASVDRGGASATSDPCKCIPSRAD